MPIDELLYQAVSARRIQWDNLVWQVPLLSLTAQAFLITIALGVGISRLSRVVASLLSLVITVLSITMMTRHRQAERADAQWLEDWEVARYGAGQAVHGHAFRLHRDRAGAEPGWVGRLVPSLPGYKTWLPGAGRLWGRRSLRPDRCSRLAERVQRHLTLTT